MDLGPLADAAFDAVVFDMDGTLVDSTPAVIRAWTVWAGEFGVGADELGRHHGMPSADVVRAVLAGRAGASAGGLDSDVVERASARIAALELADVADVVVLPGAVEALAALADAPNAIATSCTVPLARARIGAAGLVPPSVLVTADDVRRGKPAPDPFLEAARRLGADPVRCLVVEDAPAGLAAARAAGCATLAVVTTTPVEDLAADAVVPDLSAVRFTVDPAEQGGLIRVRPA